MCLAFGQGLEERATDPYSRERGAKTEVYHQLCTLQREINEAEFRVMLQDFLTYISKHYKDFYKYFSDNYCNTINQWGTCFRRGATVNTNMFLEASHRVLKVVYLNHKQNRRIDFLITTLLKISRDKAFERFRKLESRKNTHRICEINKRHKSAQQMSDNEHDVVSVSEEEWKVRGIRN